MRQKSILNFYLPILFLLLITSLSLFMFISDIGFQINFFDENLPGLNRPTMVAATSSYDVKNAFPNLSFENPVGIYHAGDGTNRLFVVEQKGVIHVFENSKDVSSTQVFLDITDQVLFGGEQGLLGLAFHPNFTENGYFYVDYTKTNPRRTVIARFTIDSVDPNQADEASELVLLEVEQPYSNHNGGQIAFGPEGYLYIALGDGGSAGDPLNNAQRRTTLLGSILRINVDTTSDGLNYAIPIDNPFSGNTEGYRKEIYAYGLRNPWRFSFDPVTGWLWTGDVGQDAWEEIDIIESGKNYGWKIMEGNHCYSPPVSCDTSGLELPIWEYGHNVGTSVTGGFVYRGSSLPDLNGSYIYGDYVFGQIWSLNYNGVDTTINTLLVDTPLLIASFGIDQQNELYICAFDGKIYQLYENSGNGTNQTSVPTPGFTIIPVITGVMLFVFINVMRKKKSKLD
ncbi:MAG: PQQ-dependent sugar dehydrogenase [Promethearchaeota archaeon]